MLEPKTGEVAVDAFHRVFAEHAADVAAADIQVIGQLVDGERGVSVMLLDKFLRFADQGGAGVGFRYIALAGAGAQDEQELRQLSAEENVPLMRRHLAEFADPDEQIADPPGGDKFRIEDDGTLFAEAVFEAQESCGLVEPVPIHLEQKALADLFAHVVAPHVVDLVRENDQIALGHMVQAAAAGIEHLAADGQDQLVIGMAVDDGADVLFVRIPADHHAGTGQHLTRLILSQLRIDIMRDCVNHANPLPMRRVCRAKSIIARMSTICNVYETKTQDNLVKNRYNDDSKKRTDEIGTEGDRTILCRIYENIQEISRK